MKKYLYAVALSASICLGAPWKPINCDFHESGDQFELNVSVGNTPVVRAYFFQGTTNTYDATGYIPVFRYSESDSDAAMYTITGTMYGTYADFDMPASSLPYNLKDWYASVVLYDPTFAEVYSYARGRITVERAPETGSPAAIPTLTAINGSLYGPFTGSFTNWPFLISSNYAGSWVNLTDFVATSELFQAHYDLLSTSKVDLVTYVSDNATLQTVYSWGDHSTNGYATTNYVNSSTNTLWTYITNNAADIDAAESNITTVLSQTSNWATAYIDSQANETSMLTLAEWRASDAYGITATHTALWDTVTGKLNTVIWTSSVASAITTGMTSQWGSITQKLDITDFETYTSSVSAGLLTETDPYWSNAQANGFAVTGEVRATRFMGTNSNVGVGYQSLIGLDGESSNNMTIGRYSGSYIEHGNENVGIGYLSLYNTEYCGTNIAIGSHAFGFGKSNYNSVAVGEYVMGYADYNNESYAFGRYALGTADGNTRVYGIGDYAGYGVQNTTNTMFIEVRPAYVGSATNDTIIIDHGKSRLTLGRPDGNVWVRGTQVVYYADVDMNNNSVTQGVYYGDGSGLTNLPASGNTTDVAHAHTWTATQTFHDIYINSNLTMIGDNIRLIVRAGYQAEGEKNAYIGTSAGQASSTTNGVFLGRSAGAASTGEYIIAIGYGTGGEAVGAHSIYAGRDSGDNSISEDAILIGPLNAGDGLVGTNIMAIGSYAGEASATTNVGSNKLFMDMYASDPDNNPTNDAVFIEDGSIHVGRGGGSTNFLRGKWTVEYLDGTFVGDIESATRYVEKDAIWTNAQAVGFVVDKEVRAENHMAGRNLIAGETNGAVLLTDSFTDMGDWTLSSPAYDAVAAQEAIGIQMGGTGWATNEGTVYAPGTYVVQATVVGKTNTKFGVRMGGVTVWSDISGQSNILTYGACATTSYFAMGVFNGTHDNNFIYDVTVRSANSGVVSAASGVFKTGYAGTMNARTTDVEYLAADVIYSPSYTGNGSSLTNLTETDPLWTNAQAAGYTMGGDITMGTNTVYGSRIGYQAGYGASGSYNKYVGYQAGLYSSNTGSHFAGPNSGQSSTGTYNYFGGYQAGKNFIGDNNAVVGVNAGESAIGSSGIYLGNHAGYLSVTTNSMFLGNYAGRSETGSGRLAIHQHTSDPGASWDATNSMIYGETGSNDLFLGMPSGDLALRGAIHAQGDITIWNKRIIGDKFGRLAGTGAVGTNNVYLGLSSGQDSEGTNSVYIGQASGQDSEGGSNLYIGLSSGYSADGSDNAYVGRHAGSYTKGNYGTYVGPFAGRLAYATNSVALGYYAGRNGRGTRQIWIDAHTNDPGATWNPTNSVVYFDGENTNLHLGTPGGNVYIRGTLTADSITATVTNETDPIWTATQIYYRVWGPDITQTETGAVLIGTAGLVKTVAVQTAATTWDATTGTLGLNTNDAAGSGDLLADGTVAMTAAFDMGGQIITNIGDGAGSLTATPVYVESDPVWAAWSNAVTLDGAWYADYTPNPASNQIPTAGWVRGLLLSGQSWYGSGSNAVGSIGFATQRVGYLWTEVQATTITQKFAMTTNDAWAGTGITTSQFTRIRGPVTYETWASTDSDNPNAYIDISYCLYYTYDLTTLLGEYCSITQRVTGDTAQKYDIVKSFNEPATTGSYYIVVRRKVSDFNIASQLNIFQGNPYPTFFTLQNEEAGGSTGGDTFATNVLANLADVDATDPAENDVLTWDGSVWTNAAASGGSDTGAVQKTGSTMTGPLTVPGIDCSSPSYATYMTISNSLSYGIMIGNLGTPAGDYEVHIGGLGSSQDFGTSVGYDSKTGAGTFGTAVGYQANGGNSGVAVGSQATATAEGVGIGRNASGSTRGVAVGRYSIGLRNGVAIGYNAYGYDTNIAIGIYSFAGGDIAPNAVAIGTRVTNNISNSARIRGDLYLDGATGTQWRSSFAVGAWEGIYSDGTNLFYRNTTGGVEQVTSM